MHNSRLDRVSFRAQRPHALRTSPETAFRFAGFLLLAGAIGLPSAAAATTPQEAILRARPATVLVISKIGAEIVMDCGSGPVEVSPTPVVETGSGWFVDGRGYVVTNAHVVLPPAVAFELEKAAIHEACVEPELRVRGLMAGQRPEIEERIRREATDRAGAAITLTPSSVTVLLSNGTTLPAEVKKLSSALRLDSKGAPLPGSGRDLALLRVKDGVFPALDISAKDGQIGDAVHVLGYPGLILAHELLDRAIFPEASVTNGAISGFRQDAIGQAVIQTDAPATYGSSGGPVIGNDAALVGVMTFVSLSPVTGTAVQGFNFLIPARDVRTFLAGTGVRIGESAFNGPWADALRAFFRGDYPGAAIKLTKVRAIAPDLPDVERVLGEALQKVNRRPSEPVFWVWAALGLTVVSAGLWKQLLGRGSWKHSGLDGVATRIHRVLDLDILRLRLVDLLKAEQLAGHFAGEIDRLFAVLARTDDLASAPDALPGAWPAPAPPGPPSDSHEGQVRPGAEGARAARGSRRPLRHRTLL